MPKYAYEFNKRWDARVPRSDIRRLMGTINVSESEESVSDSIRRRCTAPAYTPALIRQSIVYALKCHRRNRQLFSRVMKG